MKKPGVKFEAPQVGMMSGQPESVRFSTYLALLKKRGTPQAVLAEFERDQFFYGSNCPTHGELKDPVIGLVGTGPGMRVAFACPWCSSPEVLAAWEKEGMRS